MTNGDADDDGRAGTARREVAREKAAAIRAEQKKKDRRNRWFLRGGIAVGLIAVVAVVALVITGTIRPPAPGPRNMLSDGIKIGQNFVAVKTPALGPDSTPVPNTSNSPDVIDITLYVDYLCAQCAQFQAVNGPQIEKWVKTGAATIEIHPIAVLTSKSAGTQYSLRAANAAACVAQYSPNSFFAFNSSLFVHQPKEGSPGLTDGQLLSRARAAGVDAVGSIRRCIDAQRFKTWVQSATSRALTDDVPNSDIGTIQTAPTILVNGKNYAFTTPFTANDFSQFVITAAGATFTENPAPSATPTTTPAG